MIRAKSRQMPVATGFECEAGPADLTAFKSPSHEPVGCRDESSSPALKIGGNPPVSAIIHHFQPFFEPKSPGSQTARSMEDKPHRQDFEQQQDCHPDRKSARPSSPIAADSLPRARPKGSAVASELPLQPPPLRNYPQREKLTESRLDSTDLAAPLRIYALLLPRWQSPVSRTHESNQIFGSMSHLAILRQVRSEDWLWKPKSDYPGAELGGISAQIESVKKHSSCHCRTRWTWPQTTVWPLPPRVQNSWKSGRRCRRMAATSARTRRP